jgi:hypothetical protein
MLSKEGVRILLAVDGRCGRAAADGTRALPGELSQLDAKEESDNPAAQNGKATPEAVAFSY